MTLLMENEAHYLFLTRMSDDGVRGRSIIFEGIRRVVSLCFLHVQGFGDLRREVVDVDFGGNRLDFGWGKQNRFFV